MALEDLVHVAETFRSLASIGGDVNLSYYLVLAGLVILLGFASFTIATLAVNAFLSMFRKPPSYTVKLILIIGLAMLIIGIIMP